MSSEEELTEALNGLSQQIKEVANRKDAKKVRGEPSGAETDGLYELAGKAAEADAALHSIRQDEALKAKREADAEIKARVDAAIRDALKNSRVPSLAAAIGAGPSDDGRTSRAMPGARLQAHPALKAMFSDYQPGEFLSALLDYRAIGIGGFDIDRINSGKGRLEELGIRYSGVPDASSSYSLLDGDQKATLGNTNTAGGYVLPNNLVDTLLKPHTQRAVLQTLVTVRNGVNVRGVDMPYRLNAPTRMTFQDWGSTKENLNETYGSYTANLGTMARIYDISKQYARFSAGAAEQDVIDELGKAAILGENFYLMAGAGTGSVGSGDPTTGIYTALNAASSFLGFSTAFSSASNSTVAGSFATMLTQLQNKLAGRNRNVEAFIVDNTTYFTAAAQGSDTAGFWNAPGGPVDFGPIPGFGRTPTGGLTYWGVPVYYDTNMGTSATTKIAIGGEFSACKLFRGMEFRIDTSDQANTRWDQNLIGFRGEQEIGFNAYTPVYVGALQMYTAVIP
jgi:hypothetical protein